VAAALVQNGMLFRFGRTQIRPQAGCEVVHGIPQSASPPQLFPKPGALKHWSSQSPNRVLAGRRSVRWLQAPTCECLALRRIRWFQRGPISFMSDSQSQRRR